MAVDIPTLGTLFLSYDTTRIRGRGTLCSAVPSPTTHDLYFNTTVDQWCVYDGTRWVTTTESAQAIPWFSVNSFPISGSPAQVLLSAARSDYQHLVTRAAIYLYINGTNNSSNYWSFGLRGDDTTPDLWTGSTSSLTTTTGGEYTTQAAIGTAKTISKFFNVLVSKTGSPGTVGTVNATVWYRLVVP